MQGWGAEVPYQGIRGRRDIQSGYYTPRIDTFFLVRTSGDTGLSLEHGDRCNRRQYHGQTSGGPPGRGIYAEMYKVQPVHAYMSNKHYRAFRIIRRCWKSLDAYA